MASLTIGPVALPGELVLLGATLVLATVMAKLWRRRWQVEVEPKVWRALWLGLLAARRRCRTGTRKGRSCRRGR